MRRIIGALAVLTLSTGAYGCVGANYTLELKNETDRVILIRHVYDPQHPERLSVERVDPGFAGPGAIWIGEKDHSIELLDEDCTILGVFSSADGVTYTVEGVQGIEASVRPYVASDGGNPIGVAPTHECGGYVTA